MLFNSNDSVEILIKARAEGQDQIKGLDSSTKAFIATQQQNESALNKVSAALERHTKLLELQAAAQAKAREEARRAREEAQNAASTFEDFAKRLQSVVSNPAYSINSPFALAGRAVQQFSQSLGPVGIIATGAAVGVGVATTAIIGLSIKAAESETALRNFALRLDLPVQAARQLSIEAKLAGVSASTLEASIRTLSAGLDDPGGSGKRQAAVLRDLGIATRELDGSDRNLGEAFLEAYQKLSQMTDKTKQAHEGTVLLGRGFKELIPALDLHAQLAGKAKELTERYSGLNAEYTKSQVVFTEIGVEVDALEKQILLKLLPTLEKAAGLIAKLLPDGRKNKFVNPDDEGPIRFGAPSIQTLSPKDLAVVTGRFLPKITGDVLAATNVGLAQSTTSIDNKYLTPLEKLETQLKVLKEAAAELNKGGIVAFDKLAEYDADKKSIANLEARIKALKDNTQYQKELASAIQEYGKKAQVAEAGELGAIQKLEAERKAALEFVDFKFKANSTLKSDVNREFDAKETQFYAKESERLLSEAAQSQIAAL